MRTCPNCGNQSPDEMAFCLQCGKSFPSSTTADDVSYERTVAMNSVPPTQAVRPPESVAYRASLTTHVPSAVPVQKKSKLGWIIGGVAALVVLAGLGGILLIGGYFFLARTQMSDPPLRIDPDPRTLKSGNTNVKPTPDTTKATTFSPPTEPTKSGSFTIQANGGWQVSDLETVGGEEFTTRADGLIDLAGLKANVGPKGVNDSASKSRRLMTDYPTGALLMRTRYADGTFSNVQPVSAAPSNGSWRNFPDERGRLEFCVNDNAPENNGGQFTVSLKFTRAPKAKK